MSLEARLRKLVEGFPEGSSVTLPVDWLRGLLDEEGPESERPLADLTVAQVAAELGRAPSTIRTWLARGDIAGAYRLKGREWRIPRGSLRAFLDAEASGSDGGTLQRGKEVDLGEWRKVRSQPEAGVA